MRCLNPATGQGRFVIAGIVIMLTMPTGCQLLETRINDDPYFEHDGMWCRSFPTDLSSARVATLTAITQLKMPDYQEGPVHHGIFIDSRTTDNYEVRIEIKPLPGYPPSTRVGVRVGGFGTHRAVCERLLREIEQRLVAAPHSPAVAMPGALTGPPSLPGAPASQPRALDPGLPAQPVPVGK